MHKIYFGYKYEEKLKSKEIARDYTEDGLAQKLIDKGIKGKITVVVYEILERRDDSTFDIDSFNDGYVNFYDSPEDLKSK